MGRRKGFYNFHLTRLFYLTLSSAHMLTNMLLYVPKISSVVLQALARYMKNCWFPAAANAVSFPLHFFRMKMLSLPIILKLIWSSPNWGNYNFQSTFSMVTLPEFLDCCSFGNLWYFLTDLLMPRIQMNQQGAWLRPWCIRIL